MSCCGSITKSASRPTTEGQSDRFRTQNSQFSEETLTEEEIKRILENITRSGETKVDLRDFYSLGDSDPLMRKDVQDLYGMRCGKSQKIFHELLWGIANQNAPLRRTKEMMSLILENYDNRILFGGHDLTSFPTPNVIAGVTEEELKMRCKLGFRAGYLKGIAEAIVSGEYTVLSSSPGKISNRRLEREDPVETFVSTSVHAGEG